MSIPSALPDGAVLLHIGPHKTGTTAIQGLLANARDDLRDAGVTYPGRRAAHHNEARALSRRPRGWTRDTETLPDPRVWERFARTVRESPGRVVASSEFFAQCTADERARLVADLGAERLHILVAARNPGSIALSTWQQTLREGKAGHLEAWLEQRFRRETPARADSGFWCWADAATVVEDWREVLDLSRIHVVVIDEGDRALLSRTFEQLLALPAGTLTDRTAPASHNRSLTAPEAELLQRAIELTRSELNWDEFSLFFRTGFARRMLYTRKPPPDEPRAGLPRWAAAQAVAEADFTIGRLQSSGVAVTGDLANLRKVPDSVDQAPIDQISVELAAEAIAGVIAGAQKRIHHLQSKARPPRPAAAGGGERRPPADRRGPSTDELTTRQLASVLRTRVRAGLARRLRRPR